MSKVYESTKRIVDEKEHQLQEALQASIMLKERELKWESDKAYNRAK